MAQEKWGVVPLLLVLCKMFLMHNCKKMQTLMPTSHLSVGTPTLGPSKLNFLNSEQMKWQNRKYLLWQSWNLWMPQFVLLKFNWCVCNIHFLWVYVFCSRAVPSRPLQYMYSFLLLLKQTPISSANSMVTSHGLFNVFFKSKQSVCVCFFKKTKTPRIELTKNTWNSVLSLKV